MTAPTVALSLKTGTMTETSEATETDSVVRVAPGATRAFYDVRRQARRRTWSAAACRRVRSVKICPGVVVRQTRPILRVAGEPQPSGRANA